MAFWDGYRWIRPVPTHPREPRPNRLRDLLASIPMLLLVPVLLVVAWVAQASTPSLAVQGVAMRGSQLTVSGQAFPRNARVQLTWDGSPASMPTARANQSGWFSVTLSVPTIASIGSHTIAAVAMKGSPSQRSRVIASVFVSVASATPSPTPTLGPTPVPVTPSPRPTATPTSRPTASPTPTTTPTARPTPTPPVGTGAINHVIIVWLENHESTSVTATSMPYYYGLLQTYGQSTSYYAVTHPSLPNYLALWSGSTQGVTDDNTHNLGATSLSNQMTAAGLSWRAYMQNYPTTGCSTGSSYSGGVDGWGVSGTYVRKHDPPMSFTYVTNSSTQCANIQPLARFDPNVNLAFVSPNLCNDAHDCSLATADAFLKAFLPSVFNATDWAHTALFVTFDEGSTSSNGGGHITMLVARPGLSSFASSTFHNHYGLTRTVEDIFGLGCLASSCSAAPLTEFLP